MKCLWICLLALSGPASFAQNALKLKIDSLVKHQQWVHDVPGYTAAVIFKNNVFYRQSFGTPQLNTKRVLTNLSDFHMASVSKPVAGTAILQLVEKGKIDLDGLLVTYLPAFTMADDRYKQITLHHVLTHTSGIPDVSDYEWHAPQNDEGAVRRYTRSFAAAKLDFAPGEKFKYSNAAYNLLADVVASISGTSFEEYTRSNIFVPAGMLNTSFMFDSIPAGRRTAPHVIGTQLTQTVSDVYPYNRIHAPSSTLHSNQDDMIRWAQVFLQKGTVGGKKIISEVTWASMTKPQMAVNETINICLSWFKTMIAGKAVFYHSGGDLGYRTFVGFEPESGTAVVLMGNNDLLNGGDNGLAVFRAIFSDEPLRLSPKSIGLVLKDHVLKNGVKKTKDEYYALQKKAPGKYDFSARSVAAVAEWMYDRGYKQESIDMLIFCTELSPGDFHWYEYIGDVYNAWDKKKEAVKWFQKASTLAPADEDIRKKLSALEAYR